MKYRMEWKVPYGRKSAITPLKIAAILLASLQTRAVPQRMEKGSHKHPTPTRKDLFCDRDQYAAGGSRDASFEMTQNPISVDQE